ncbi:MAG: protein kinase [Planctomycetes bacterium]|nr:protein kinase [Planctomycetota bacterium]
MPTITCPNEECGKSYQVSGESLGGRARCKSCGSVIELEWDSGISDASVRSAAVVSEARDAKPLKRPVESSRATPSNSSESTPAETAQPVDTKADVAKTSSQAAIPETLGRFQIKSELGAGAFGTVYLAYDPVLEREVALKVPQASVVGNEEAAARFLREAKAAAQLTHPNIVPIFDAGSDGQDVFIASKYIEGQTLDAAIKEGRLDDQRAAEVLRQLADALAYAHDQGVIHRDIKPANIILDQQGQPHVMDFGLARLADERQKLTQEGSLLGTPAYMSPEQAGEPGLEVGPASDQYSLGVVLFELLCDQRPFSGTLATLIYQIRKEDPPAPRSIRAEIPKDLEIICLKAMAKEPERRYTGCLDLSEDLRRWSDGESIHARSVSSPERLFRWAIRNPVPAGLVAAVFVVLCSGIVASSFFAMLAFRRADDAMRAKERLVLSEANEKQLHQDSVKEKENAIVAKEEAIKAENEAIISANNLLKKTQELEKARIEAERSGDEKQLIIERLEEEKKIAREQTQRANTAQGLDAFNQYVQRITRAERELTANNLQYAERILDQCAEQLRDWEWRYLKGACRSESYVQKVTKFTANSAEISTDGKWLATAGGSSCKIWDPNTRRLVHDLPSKTGLVHCVAFDKESKRVASSAGKVVKIWDVSSGDLICDLAEHDDDVIIIAFLPDGKHVVSVARNKNATWWNVDSQSIVRKTPGRVHFGALSVSPNGNAVALAGDGKISFWNGKELRAGFTAAKRSAYNDVDFHPDGQHLITLGSDRYVRLWNLASRKEVWSFKVDTERPRHLAVSPDSKRLVTGSMDGSVTVWDTETKSQHRTLDRHTSGVTSVAVSKDGRQVISAGGSDVRVTTLAGQNVVSTMLNRQVVDVSRAGLHVASAHNVNDITVLDAASGVVLKTLSGDAAFDRVALNPKRPQIAASCSERWWDTNHGFDDPAKKVAMWDLESGKLATPLVGHLSAVTCLVYSPDGSLIATGSGDRMVKVWNTENSQEVSSFNGHSNVRPSGINTEDIPIVSIAFSLDGKTIASAGSDRTIKVWKAHNGELIWNLVGHTEVDPMRWAQNGVV